MWVLRSAIGIQRKKVLRSLSSPGKARTSVALSACILEISSSAPAFPSPFQKEPVLGPRGEAKDNCHPTQPSKEIFFPPASTYSAGTGWQPMAPSIGLQGPILPVHPHKLWWSLWTLTWNFQPSSACKSLPPVHLPLPHPVSSWEFPGSYKRQEQHVRPTSC